MLNLTVIYVARSARPATKPFGFSFKPQISMRVMARWFHGLFSAKEIGATSSKALLCGKLQDLG